MKNKELFDVLCPKCKRHLITKCAGSFVRIPKALEPKWLKILHAYHHGIHPRLIPKKLGVSRDAVWRALKRL